jgi:hypothetical protein
MNKTEKIQEIRDIRGHLSGLISAIQRNDSEWIATYSSVALYKLTELVGKEFQEEISALKIKRLKELSA